MNSGLFYFHENRFILPLSLLQAKGECAVYSVPDLFQKNDIIKVSKLINPSSFHGKTFERRNCF